MNEISFKCEDSLWQMLADGSKTFDMRRYDSTDERITRLSWGRSQRVSQGRSIIHDRWEPEVQTVSFINKVTGKVLTFKYKGMEFISWAPGWCFLLLGEKVR